MNTGELIRPQSGQLPIKATVPPGWGAGWQERCAPSAELGAQRSCHSVHSAQESDGNGLERHRVTAPQNQPACLHGVKACTTRRTRRGDERQRADKGE